MCRMWGHATTAPDRVGHEGPTDCKGGFSESRKLHGNIKDQVDGTSCLNQDI